MQFAKPRVGPVTAPVGPLLTHMNVTKNKPFDKFGGNEYIVPAAFIVPPKLEPWTDPAAVVRPKGAALVTVARTR